MNLLETLSNHFQTIWWLWPIEEESTFSQDPRGYVCMFTLWHWDLWKQLGLGSYCLSDHCNPGRSTVLWSLSFCNVLTVTLCFWKLSFPYYWSITSIHEGKPKVLYKFGTNVFDSKTWSELIGSFLESLFILLCIINSLMFQHRNINVSDYSLRRGIHKTWFLQSLIFLKYKNPSILKLLWPERFQMKDVDP